MAEAGRLAAVAATAGAALAVGVALAAPAAADAPDQTRSPTVAGAAGGPADSGAPRARRGVRAEAPQRAARTQVAPARSVPRPRPLAATAVPAPAAAPRSSLSPVASAAGTDPISALLNNAPPKPTGTETARSPTGVIRGTLQGNDPDSPVVRFALAGGPARGSLTIAPDGQFTYTADPTRAHTGYVDSFRITASDADSGFHIHGLAGLVNLLTFGLIGTAGHTATTSVSLRVDPFNNAPTGTASAGEPDPVTGTVSGQVNGRDLNGDPLTYSGPTATDHGTVTVTPTGRFTYTPTAEALAAATPGQRDRFTVVIDDGYGATTAVDVVVPLGSSAPIAPLSTFCGCTLMPADTVFHADVSGLPVLSQSDTWTALLDGTLHAGWGRPPWQGSSGGMPVNVVGPQHPTETVIFNRGYSTSGPSIDDRPYAIPDRPLVEGMPDVPAWDRHLLVFQEGSCISQELYNVANGVELPAAGVLDALGNAAYAALWGSAWIAEAGVHVDMSSPLYPAQGWANASRLPYLPLILRPDDLERGQIDHMLGIAIAKDRGTGHTWPARAGDGTGTNPDGVPMGTVFRLRADFDISDYQPGTQVVLRGLQQHGAVVFDSFAAGRDGAGLLVMSNGWTGTAHFTVQDELSTIPLSAFEAVDVLSLAADPSTGWAIRSSSAV